MAVAVCSPVSASIQDLKEKQDIFIIDRADESYPETDKSFSLNGHLSPAAQCVPSTIQALAYTTRLASANNIDLGIRSGHWLPWGAASRGICISTSKLKKLDIDAGSHVVRVGAGVTKAEADKYLQEYGQAVASTTLPSSTLIGAAIEGGIGWLSGEHGLACDQMLSATIVVADGSILECSTSENEDLFWAIKGAGTNFGVVVEASFRTINLRRHVYSAVVSYPTSSLRFVINTVAQIHKTLPATSRISMRIEACEGRTEIVLHLFHNGERSEANTTFAPLILDARKVEASMVPYAGVGSQYISNPDHASGNRWASAGIHLAGPWINSEDLLAMCNEFIREAGHETMSSLRYAVLGIDVQNMSQISKSSADDSAFAARCAGAVCYSRFVWDDGQFDAIYEHYARQFGHKWSTTIGPKSGAPVAYPAFCAPDQMTAEEAYGLNYARLQKLKAKYDPKEVFSKRRMIVPASI